MNVLMAWSRLPPDWVLEGRLAQLNWKDHKAASTAALLLLLPLAHHMAVTPTPTCPYGYAKISFNDLAEITGVSKPLIRPALNLLSDVLGVVRIEVAPFGGSHRYGFVADTERNFRKVPARGLYDRDAKRLVIADYFKLRSKAELNALKLYYLFIVMRDESKNYASVAYSNIEKYTGVRESDVKKANSHLINAGLIHVDQVLAPEQTYRHNAYRIIGIKPRIHAGTQNLAETERFRSGGIPDHVAAIFPAVNRT